MHLSSPIALSLFPLMAGLWWVSRRRRRQRQAVVDYSSVGLLRQVGAVIPAWQDHLPVALMALSMICLILALARPQYGAIKQRVASNGIDIMLCLDTSGSMNCQDLLPSRVAAATAVSQQFVKERPHDRIGLVVFSSLALTECPLTTDHNALRIALSATKVGMTRADGTALGSAMATCINRLKDVPGKSKVIILLTDGSNNSGEIDPLTAASMAAQYGIKVYTIGMGTNGLAPITVDDPTWGERTVMVRGDLDEATLEKIADLTHGKFYRATDTEALQGVYSDINRLEKVTVPRSEITKYHEMYAWFLVPGTLLLGLKVLLERTLWKELV